MTITLHGSFTAWALYIGGSIGVMAGMVMLALAFADVKRANETIKDDSDCFHSEVK